MGSMGSIGMTSCLFVANARRGLLFLAMFGKAVGRRCCELLPAEAQQRLIANVPVFLSYGRASAFSGSEGCECVFEDIFMLHDGANLWWPAVLLDSLLGTQ